MNVEHKPFVFDYWMPIAALVRRELVRTLRKKRFAAVVALGFGWSAALLGLNWPREIDTLYIVRDLGIGIPVLTLFGIGCLGIAMLPGYAAAAIRGEKDRDTYEMMGMTMLTPAGILFGKLLNVIGVFVVIVVAALPLAATAFFLMGLDWQFLLPFALLLVLALTCVSAGLFCSSIASTLPRALVGTYVLIAVLMGGYLIPLYAAVGAYMYFAGTDRYSMPTPFYILESLVAITPVATMDQWMSSLYRPTVSPQFFWACAQQLFFSFVMLFLTWLILRRRPGEESRLVALVQRQPIKLLKPAQAPVPPIPDHRNAIFVREIRALTTAWQRARFRVVLVIILTLGVFLMTGYAIWEVRRLPDIQRYDEIYDAMVYAWVMGLTAVAALVAPGVSTPLWARERDKDTREQLMMTLMRPRDIVIGKSGAALCFTLTTVLIALLATSPLVVSLTNVEHGFIKVITGISTIVVTALCVIAIGSQAAQLRVNTTATVVLSYGLTAAYMLGPVFLLAYTIDLMYAMGVAQNYVKFMLLFSPLLTWLDAAFPDTFMPQNRYATVWDRILFLFFVLAIHSGLAMLFLFDSIRVEGKFKKTDRPG